MHKRNPSRSLTKNSDLKRFEHILQVSAIIRSWVNPSKTAILSWSNSGRQVAMYIRCPAWKQTREMRLGWTVWEKKLQSYWNHPHCTNVVKTMPPIWEWFIPPNHKYYVDDWGMVYYCFHNIIPFPCLKASCLTKIRWRRWWMDPRMHARMDVVMVTVMATIDGGGDGGSDGDGDSHGWMIDDRWSMMGWLTIEDWLLVIDGW